MHEFSIVASIVERVLEFLDGHKAKRFVALRLAIGELTCVDAEQLRSCYELVTEGTAIAGSELEIEQTRALVKCPNCNFQGHRNMGRCVVHAFHPNPAMSRMWVRRGSHRWA